MAFHAVCHDCDWELVETRDGVPRGDMLTPVRFHQMDGHDAVLAEVADE